MKFEFLTVNGNGRAITSDQVSALISAQLAVFDQQMSRLPLNPKVRDALRDGFTVGVLFGVYATLAAAEITVKE